MNVPVRPAPALRTDGGKGLETRLPGTGTQTRGDRPPRPARRRPGPESGTGRSSARGLASRVQRLKRPPDGRAGGQLAGGGGTRRPDSPPSWWSPAAQGRPLTCSRSPPGSSLDMRSPPAQGSGPRGACAVTRPASALGTASRSSPLSRAFGGGPRRSSFPVDSSDTYEGTGR